MCSALTCEPFGSKLHVLRQDRLPSPNDGKGPSATGMLHPNRTRMGAPASKNTMPAFFWYHKEAHR